MKRLLTAFETACEQNKAKFVDHFWDYREKTKQRLLTTFKTEKRIKQSLLTTFETEKRSNVCWPLLRLHVNRTKQSLLTTFETEKRWSNVCWPLLRLRKDETTFADHFWDWEKMKQRLLTDFETACEKNKHSFCWPLLRLNCLPLVEIIVSLVFIAHQVELS